MVAQSRLWNLWSEGSHRDLLLGLELNDELSE